MSYCHVLMWLMSQAVKSTYLSLLPLLPVFSPPLSHPPKLLCCPAVSAPSVSATPAPSAGAGRRRFVGEGMKEKIPFSDISQLFRCFLSACGFGVQLSYLSPWATSLSPTSARETRTCEKISGDVKWAQKPNPARESDFRNFLETAGF